jgi:hypothetical protein
MRKIVCGLLCVVCSCFASCIIVSNARGESNICKVHNKRMKKVMVGTDFGLSAYDTDPKCPNAKEKQNMGCEVKPWPIYRLAIMYHCSVCDSIKRAQK